MSTDEKEKAAYNQRARRMTYLRWRLKEGKPLTEEQLNELDAYTAEKHGADADALAQIRAMTATEVKGTKADDLRALLQKAGLLPEEDSSTKADMQALVEKFQSSGFLEARVA